MEIIVSEHRDNCIGGTEEIRWFEIHLGDLTEEQKDALLPMIQGVYDEEAEQQKKEKVLNHGPED